MIGLKGGSDTAGTAALLLFNLRRDRVWLTCWLLALVALVAATVSSYAALYPDAASLRPLQATIGGDATLRAIYGPAFDLSTLGGLTAWRVSGSGSALAGLMGLLLVVRHTRLDEEAGRLELLRSTVVGRRAPLLAALLEAVLASLVLTALIAAVLVGQHLPAPGALALGAAFGGCGLSFASVAAVTAQLSENARSARSIALSTLALAYLARAFGDAGTGETAALHWLSPVGWSQQLRPFAGERWAVLALPLLGTAALAAVGFALQGRRDLGAGLLPARLGPAHGKVRTASGLAWRLQRGSLVGWCVAMAVTGALVGVLASQIGTLVGENAGLTDVLRRISGSQRLLDSYFGAVFGLLALGAAVHGIQAALRVREEESLGHAELLLASGASRKAVLLSHAAYAVVGPAVLMVVAGVTAGAARAVAAGDLGQLWPVLGASVAQVPAIEVLVGVTLALVGIAPRLAPAAWGVLAVCALIGQVGPLLRLPTVLLRLSPFSSSPHLPGGQVELLPLVALVAVAAVLAGWGGSGWRRRDLTG